MMKKIIGIGISLIIGIGVLIQLSHARATLKESPFTTEESQKIILKIYEKNHLQYSKYRGIKSTRYSETKEYDSVSGKLLNTYTMVSERKDFYYKKTENNVISYKINNLKQDPKSYKDRGGGPLYPLFDDDYTAHYTLTLAGIEKMDGVKCYRIEVLPKENTIHHFKGTVWCNVKNLDMCTVEGTSGKLEYPLTELFFSLKLKQSEDAAVVTWCYFRTKIHVPILFPNRMFESTVIVTENQTIPNKL